MTDIELKPCPCCGSENVTFFTGLPDGYIVSCNNCHAGLKYGLKTKEQAAATWNRAFQVGLMLAEKIRVELEERQKNHKRPFEQLD